MFSYADSRSRSHFKVAGDMAVRQTAALFKPLSVSVLKIIDHFSKIGWQNITGYKYSLHFDPLENLLSIIFSSLITS